MADIKALDVHSIRYGNLNCLYEQFKRRPDEVGQPDYGRVRRFADHIGWGQRYVSGLLRQDKSIGHQFCRALEKRLNLPHGWMDLPYSAANRIAVECESEAEKQFAEISLALFRAFPQAQQRLMEIVRQEVFKEQKTVGAPERLDGAGKVRA